MHCRTGMYPLHCHTGMYPLHNLTDFHRSHLQLYPLRLSPLPNLPGPCSRGCHPGVGSCAGLLCWPSLDSSALRNPDCIRDPGGSSVC